MNTGPILRLVPLIGTGEPPLTGASKVAIYKSRLRQTIGRMLNRFRVPGVVRPLAFDDPLTGDRIRVSTDSLFTVLSINGRDYYFRRLSGRFDGTGMGCS